MGLLFGLLCLNFELVIVGEMYEYIDMYLGMVKIVCDEGFDEIVNWFEMFVKVECSYVNCYMKVLDSFVD